MAKSFQRELLELREKHSLTTRTECTEEETKELKELKKTASKSIPIDIREKECWENGDYQTTFYHVQNDVDISYDERTEYLLLKQTEHLTAIRKMLLFFVVLTCIGLAAGLILALKASGA